MKKTELPLPLPAPVLELAGHHYLPFTEFYGKIPTTEKDCPSLIQKGEKKKDQSVKFNLIASRVVSTLQCVQCEKRRCVFALDSRIAPKDQQELEDVIFSCGMSLMGANLYTLSHLMCQSEMEISYYNSQAMTNYVCYHCRMKEITTGSFKDLKKKFEIVYPACVDCEKMGKKINAVILLKILIPQVSMCILFCINCFILQYHRIFMLKIFILDSKFIYFKLREYFT